MCFGRSIFLVVGILAMTAAALPAQTMASTPQTSGDDRLEILLKKIDEQNAKIDLLSQQILKLEQQITNGSRPGVVIGEATPLPSTASSAADTPHPQNGSSHVVARGETLTSIAKMHNVSVSELQKFNHIENDRKLQIGQTILLPGAAAPSPSVSSSPGE